MRLVDGGNQVVIELADLQMLERHLEQFEPLLDALAEYVREAGPSDPWQAPWEGMKDPLKAAGILGRGVEIVQRLDKSGEVVLALTELQSLRVHLEQCERLVHELESRAYRQSLDPLWSGEWHRLRNFLEAEELPGSEVTGAVDGRYCCQWRTTGLHSGVTDCHQYNAWYVFAWSACTAAAAASGRDATMQAGECSAMQGCPNYRP